MQMKCDEIHNKKDIFFWPLNMSQNPSKSRRLRLPVFFLKKPSFWPGVTRSNDPTLRGTAIEGSFQGGAEGSDVVPQAVQTGGSVAEGKSVEFTPFFEGISEPHGPRTHELCWFTNKRVTNDRSTWYCSRCVNCGFKKCWFHKLNWLVFWLPFFIFPEILGLCHHPNWRTHIFQRGGPTTKQ